MSINLGEHNKAFHPKLYLAGPMRNIPYFNFPAFFAATEVLERQGYEVFNPAQKDVDRHGDGVYKDFPTGSIPEAAAKYGFNLREALQIDTNFICLHATHIAMLPNWEKSSGATAERALAIALGLEIIYL